MDLHQGIITALRRARAFTQQREFFRAAASYEKASDLMTIYAEQAFGREAEARRKARASSTGKSRTSCAPANGAS